MKTLMAAALLLAAAGPCAAAATDWQQLAPDTRVRLIASEKLEADGTTLAAIELDMPLSTNTYWRVPGESGIPAKLDLSGSKGIVGQQFLWPFPEISVKAGYTDYVYYGPVVIPVRLSVDARAARLEAALTLGICSDICVPAQALFSLPLDFNRPDAGEDIRIAQAMAHIPIPWAGAADPVGEPRFDPAEGMLWIPYDPAEVDPGSLIADASESGHLFGAPQKSPQENVVGLPLLGADKSGDLVGGSIRILFMTSNGPFEVERRVKALAGDPL